MPRTLSVSVVHENNQLNKLTKLSNYIQDGLRSEPNSCSPKKFPTCCSTQRFITVFAKGCQLSQTCAMRPIHILPPNFRFISVLLSNLCPYLQVVSSRFQSNSSIHFPPPQSTALDALTWSSTVFWTIQITKLIEHTLVCFDKLQSSAFSNSFQPPPLHPLSPNIPKRHKPNLC